MVKRVDKGCGASPLLFLPKNKKEMITNFEDITGPLNGDEKALVAELVKICSKRTKDNPIKDPALRRALMFATNIRIAGSRLRKLVHFTRKEGILPIIATSKGYYCSYDQEEISKCANSLRERASAINSAADGLMKHVV